MVVLKFIVLLGLCCAAGTYVCAADVFLCSNDVGVVQSQSQITFDSLADKRPCSALDIEGDFCINGAVDGREYYQVDVGIAMDYSESNFCTSEFAFNAVQVGGVLDTLYYCNDSQPGFPQCAATNGAISVQVTVNNIRYKRLLIPEGQIPYDTISLTQPTQFWDMYTSLGEQPYTNVGCISDCYNTSEPCTFRANDVNGTYCYNQDLQAGPTGYNCINVQQNVFYAGNTDLSVSCCGDCQSCLCNGTNPSTSYFPQISPSALYDLYLNSASPFLIDTNEPGSSGNNTNNISHPVYMWNGNWPTQPTASDRDYYNMLNTCPASNCVYENGGWFAPLRRSPEDSSVTYATDISGKLACGYCGQGPVGRLGCGIPANPGIFGMQTWMVGMTPVCSLCNAVDESFLVGDLSITITNPDGSGSTIQVNDFELENQVYSAQTSDGLIYVEITRDFSQTPLDDPMVQGSLIGVCAPDALGQDFSPLDPTTWSDPTDPWTGRIGPDSGLPDCFGCLPDQQSQNGQPRLWWMTNYADSTATFDLSNVGQPGLNGVTNAVWQDSNCDNPLNDTTGCPPDVTPNLRSAACYSNAPATYAIPHTPPALIAQAFQTYRDILAQAVSKEIDPLFMDPGPYLPPFYNYKAPNVFIESVDGALYLVYKPISSPFDSTVQQSLQARVVFDSSIISSPTLIPPVVNTTQDFSFCNMITATAPRIPIGGGTITLILSSASLPPPAVDPNVLYTIAAQMTTVLDEPPDVTCTVNTYSRFTTRLSYSAQTTVSVECTAASALDIIYALDQVEITVQVGSIVAGVFAVIVCPPEYLVGEYSSGIITQSSVPLATWVSNYSVDIVPFADQTGPGSHYQVAYDLNSNARGMSLMFYVVIIVASSIMWAAGISIFIATMVKLFQRV